MTPRQVLSVVLAAATVGLADLSATRAETKRTVYIAASDSKGAAITDLTAADFTVKEGGKDASVVSLEPAKEKMDVVLLVDDMGSGAFQPSVLQLLQALLENAQFSIYQFTPQAVKLTDFTSEIPVIQGALDKLGPRGKIDRDGEQLNEAIGASARLLRERKAVRPVIVVFTIAGVGQVRNANFVMDDLHNSGAMLNVMYVNSSDVGQIIGDGPRHSGGRIEMASGVNAFPAAVTRIIDTLTHQYLLTYTLADGVKPANRLSVSTRRKGITLLAPTHIPDR